MKTLKNALLSVCLLTLMVGLIGCGSSSVEKEMPADSIQDLKIEIYQVNAKQAASELEKFLATAEYASLDEGLKAYHEQQNKDLVCAYEVVNKVEQTLVKDKAALSKKEKKDIAERIEKYYPNAIKLINEKNVISEIKVKTGETITFYEDGNYKIANPA